MRMAAFLLLCSILCGRQLHAAGPTCVAVSLHDARGRALHFLLRRQDIYAEVFIRRHAHHHAVRLIWSSDTGSNGSATLDLDGAKAFPLWTIRLPDQPYGRYVFTAEVLDAMSRILGHAQAYLSAPKGS